MHKILATLFILLTGTLLSAQNKDNSRGTRFTLNGYIKDSLSGESIIGATISIDGQSRGVASNQYGFYSRSLL